MDDPNSSVVTQNSTSLTADSDTCSVGVDMMVVTEVDEADFQQAKITFEACKKAGLPGEELIPDALILTDGKNYPGKRFTSRQTFASEEELIVKTQQVWLSGDTQAVGSYGIHQQSDRLLDSGEETGQGGTSLVKSSNSLSVVDKEERVVKLGVVVKKRLKLLGG